jgi:hypothetical protein
VLKCVLRKKELLGEGGQGGGVSCVLKRVLSKSCWVWRGCREVWSTGHAVPGLVSFHDCKG